MNLLDGSFLSTYYLNIKIENKRAEYWAELVMARHFGKAACNLTLIESQDSFSRLSDNTAY